jgi:ketosteroid isomerase-like protein
MLRRSFVVMAAAAFALSTDVEVRLPNLASEKSADRDINVVRSLWTAFEQRAWREARILFHDDAVLSWPVSRERIAGADGIIRVQEIYPEGWTIVPHRFAKLTDGEVMSIVRVVHPPNSFFAVSFFTMSNGRIKRAEEYWSTIEEPSSWRTREKIPGWARETAQVPSS